VHLAIR